MGHKFHKTVVLPYDPELPTPEIIYEWLQELGIILDEQLIDGYPSRFLNFSEYSLDPPTIRIYRYLPMEDWLNLISQHQVGYYGPWYFLHIVQRIYYHLELQDLYSINRCWYHRLFGRLSTLDERAYSFTQEFLKTLHSPARFDEAVDRSFRPGSMVHP